MEEDVIKINFTRHDDATNERIKLYFDLIVGTLLSAGAMVGLFFWTNIVDINSYMWWLVGFIFWLCYLGLSLFLIGVGFYTRYKEKHYHEREPRKDLRAPIVS